MTHPYFQGFGIFVFPGPPRDVWAAGWLTGLDSDLICARPNIVETRAGDLALSPVCTHPLLAILGLVLKRVLLTIDLNLTT